MASMTNNTKGKGKQVNLLSMLGLKRNAPSLDKDMSIQEIIKESIGDHSVSLENTIELTNEMKRVSKEKLKFQENWLSKYKWLQEELDIDLLCCNVCRKDPHCKSPFGTTGSKNFKTSALEEHAKCVAHRDVVLLQERDKNSLETYALKKQASVDLAIEKLFKCAYYIAKQDLAFCKLESLAKLLGECGVEGLPHMYNDNKACASFVINISKALEVEIYNSVRKSPWFGLMVDEPSNVSVTKNLILYATFVEGRKVKTAYLGLLEVEDGNAYKITECILNLLRKWDMDINKMMGFGNDRFLFNMIL